MESFAVVLIAMSALSVTVPMAWLMTRNAIGEMSTPSFGQNEGTFSCLLVGVIVGAAALVIRHDGWAVLAAVGFALAGIVAGVLVGWISRDPSDRAER